MTSDHTLSRLHQPLLAEEQLHQLLGDMTLSHKQAVYNLCAEYTQFFTKWMFALRYKGIQFTYITKFQVKCICFDKKSFIMQGTASELMDSRFPEELYKKSPLGSTADDSLLLGYNTASLGSRFLTF